MSLGLSAGRWRGLILIAWTAGLALLLGFGRYSLFIRAQLWPLVLCNVLILLLFLVAMVIRPIHGGSRRITAGAWVRGGMLLLPLLYMASLLSGAAQAGLDSQAFKTKWLGSTSLEVGASDSSAVVPSDQVRSLASICQFMHKLAGTRVVSEGRIYRDPALPPGQVAIFRFVVVCCAADAIPVEVAVKSPKASSFKDDDWVRVGGKLRIDTRNGQEFPVIEADQIDPIAAPDDPYLSPTQF